MDVFLNGEWIPEEQATVSAFDRGLLYGDGVFETVRVYQGHAFLLGRHLGRLAHGLSGLHIEDPYSFDEWTAHCRELITRNKVSDGILRLHITRGTGKRGYSSMGSGAPTVLISLHDAPPWLIRKHSYTSLPRLESSVTTTLFPRSRPLTNWSISLPCGKLNRPRSTMRYY